MICSILRWTRHPSGRNVQRPAVTWRMKPPRTSSLWLTASASAGASRRVGRKSCDARAIIAAGRLVAQRDRGRLGHRQGGRFRHLQPLRAVHPALDPAVDLVEELLDEDVARDLLQHAAVRVDEADVAPAGDSEVGVAALARAVDGAAEDGDLEMLRIGLQALFDALRELLHADVVASAGGAGDQDRPALAQPERAQDLPRDLHLLDRVGGERDADRVADPVDEQRAHPDRALDRAGEGRPGLRDAEVERVRDALGEHPVGADHRRHVARLDADLEVAVVEPLEQAHLLQRRLDERLRLVALRELFQVTRERARVGADPHRDPLRLGGADDLLDFVVAADVPGVDPDGGDAGVDRAQSEARVEVDVRDHRERAEADDRGQRVCVVDLRDGDADDLAPGARERRDLRRRRRHVVRLRQRHRLDDDRRAAADLDAADAHGAFACHRVMVAAAFAATGHDRPVQAVALAVRFALELCALAALAWWGFSFGDGAVSYVVGLGAPVAAAVVWGVLAAPKGRFDGRDPQRLAGEVVVFG